MEEILTSIIKKKIVGVVVSKMVTALPFLGWPILNPILVYFVGKVFQYAYEELEREIKFLIIDAQAKARSENYKEIKSELERLLKEKGLDDEETKKASLEFDERLNDLIRFPGLRSSDTPR